MAYAAFTRCSSFGSGHVLLACADSAGTTLSAADGDDRTRVMGDEELVAVTADGEVHVDGDLFTTFDYSPHTVSSSRGGSPQRSLSDYPNGSRTLLTTPQFINHNLNSINSKKGASSLLHTPTAAIFRAAADITKTSDVKAFATPTQLVASPDTFPHIHLSPPHHDDSDIVGPPSTVWALRQGSPLSPAATFLPTSPATMSEPFGAHQQPRDHQGQSLSSRLNSSCNCNAGGGVGRVGSSAGLNTSLIAVPMTIVRRGTRASLFSTTYDEQLSPLSNFNNDANNNINNLANPQMTTTVTVSSDEDRVRAPVSSLLALQRFFHDGTVYGFNQTLTPFAERFASCENGRKSTMLAPDIFSDSQVVGELIQQSQVDGERNAIRTDTTTSSTKIVSATKINGHTNTRSAIRRRHWSSGANLAGPPPSATATKEVISSGHEVSQQTPLPGCGGVKSVCTNPYVSSVPRRLAPLAPLPLEKVTVEGKADAESTTSNAVEEGTPIGDGQQRRPTFTASVRSSCCSSRWNPLSVDQSVNDDSDDARTEGFDEEENTTAPSDTRQTHRSLPPLRGPRMPQPIHGGRQMVDTSALDADTQLFATTTATTSSSATALQTPQTLNASAAAYGLQLTPASFTEVGQQPRGQETHHHYHYPWRAFHSRFGSVNDHSCEAGSYKYSCVREE